MKKSYETIETNVIFFYEEVVRTSNNDNVTDLPEFPEIFG